MAVSTVEAGQSPIQRRDPCWFGLSRETGYPDCRGRCQTLHTYR